MGSRFLKYQENFILEAFALHLEGSDRILSRPSEKEKGLLYDFRELKCICQNVKSSDEQENDKSIGESFIQYYYLCQRRIHSEVEMQCEQFKGEENFYASESTKMTLNDVVKVKKMADNISFMRLFFLKNQQTYIDCRSSSSAASAAAESKLELIDCVMAIYLFEISRITRSGKHLYRKDQFQYQVLHFFNNLRSCKTEDTGQAQPVSAFSQLQKQAKRRNMRPGRIDRIEEESGNESDEDPHKIQLTRANMQLSDVSDSEEDLDELISGMKISCEG